MGTIYSWIICKIVHLKDRISDNKKKKAKLFLEANVKYRIIFIFNSES